MTARAYEYYGLMAVTWDLFRGDTSCWVDRFFFLDMIQACGQPVLDVGCGAGRLLLDYLTQGLDVDGVDNSPDMLDLCRQKAVKLGLQPTLYHQRMESLELPRRYQMIIVPSSSFQLLLTPAVAAEAMRRFYHHLQPGGFLVMPFMLIWRPGDPLDTGWALSGDQVRPEDGARVQRWSRAWYDVAQQLEHTEDRYVVSRDGTVIQEELHQQSPATRWYTQAQAQTLYEAAGFVDLTMRSHFSQTPATAEDTVFTITGRRP